MSLLLGALVLFFLNYADPINPMTVDGPTTGITINSASGIQNTAFDSVYQPTVNPQ